MKVRAKRPGLKPILTTDSTGLYWTPWRLYSCRSVLKLQLWLHQSQRKARGQLSPKRGGDIIQRTRPGQWVFALPNPTESHALQGRGKSVRGKVTISLTDSKGRGCGGGEIVRQVGMISEHRARTKIDLVCPQDQQNTKVEHIPYMFHPQDPPPKHP